MTSPFSNSQGLLICQGEERERAKEKAKIRHRNSSQLSSVLTDVDGGQSNCTAFFVHPAGSFAFCS